MQCWNIVEKEVFLRATRPLLKEYKDCEESERKKEEKSEKENGEERKRRKIAPSEFACIPS